MVLQKKPPLLITLGAALLLIGGGALTFWATSRRSTWVKALPEGANAIPDNALMVLALSSDQAQWQRLRQFGTPTTQAQVDQILAQWRDRLLANQDLTFATDIQPWVGPEITLAVLPTETSPTAAAPAPLPDPATALTANLLVVVPIADAAKAQNDLGNRLAEATTPEDNPYRGVTIQQIDGQADAPLYAAVLSQETAVLSPQLPLLKQSIDAFKGGKSIVDRPGFSKAFEQLDETKALARWYVDVPTAVQTLSAAADPPLPPNRLKAFQAPRGLVGTAILNNRGLYLQGISWLDQGPQTFATDNKADQMPQRLPADTLMMVSGGDFQRFWEDFQAGNQLSALFPFRPDDLSLGLQTATGLSLQEDLLPWMAGEFALGVLKPPAPAAKEAAPLPNPALVLMVRTNNREAATATFERLDQVLASRYRFSVDAVDLGGVPVTRWTAPFGSLAFAYGWLGEDVVFLSVGTGVAELVAPAPARTLGESALFQAVTGEAPRPNNGHFFLDLEGLGAAENSLLLPPLPKDGLLSIEAIEAIGVTATVISDRQVRYDLMTVLKRGDRPGPLPQASDPTPAPPPVPESASPVPPAGANPASSPEAAPEAVPQPSPQSAP
ncbi:MAG: DUF3352 domain-containing protein [Nodosilinea sp.]